MATGDTLHIYYGASDSCMALATASISDCLRMLDDHGKPSC